MTCSGDKICHIIEDHQPAGSFVPTLLCVIGEGEQEIVCCFSERARKERRFAERGEYTGPAAQYS